MPRISFHSESLDLLDQVEQNLLMIPEDNSCQDDVIAETFRAIHSFKGNCGLFELTLMEKISHKMETLLDKVRQGD